MKKNPTVFLIVFLCCILRFSVVLAYDAKTTHPNLTAITVDFYNQYFVNQPLDNEEKQFLMQGSIDEDNGIRCINHFYDPVSNKTWQFGGIENLFPSLTAKEWAQNPFAQAVYDPIYLALVGPITKSPVFAGTNFTWQQAIYKYVKGDKAGAFYALGHVLHLIQDMSVPEHTRQNTHIFFIESARSPYEIYAAKNAKDFYMPIKKEIQEKLPVQEFTLDDYFDDIAFYSHNYFYSPDTISNIDYSSPQPVFSEVPEWVDGKLLFYAMGQDENADIFHLALILKNDIDWRFISGPTIYSLEDNQVLADYWERLSRRAVLTGAGVIDLFFQEAEKEKAKSGFISGSEGNILTAMIGGVAGFFDAIFQEDADFLVTNGSMNDELEDEEGATTTNSMEHNYESTTTSSTVKSTTTSRPKNTTTTKEKEQAINWCDFYTSQAPQQSNVIINEVAWMGTAESANNEWIELKNFTAQNIDVGGWQLLDQNGQIKIIFNKNSIISPYGFYLLERSDDTTVPGVPADYIFTGIINNTEEGLRLFDENCVLQDRVSADPEWPAGDNAGKLTMERGNDLSWHTYSGSGNSGIYGTPKGANSEPVFGSDNGESSVFDTTTTTITTTTTTNPPINYPKIIISEIKVAGTDEDNTTMPYEEFIELFNPNEFSVDLTGWYMQKKTSQGESFSSLAPGSLWEGKSINSLDYLLIAHASSTDVVLADIVITNYSVTDNNSIVLKNPNMEIVDKVGFGEANDCEGNCAINPAAGQSIQRKRADDAFLDSDNNAADFEIQDCPSPKDFLNENCSVTTTTTTTAGAVAKVPYISDFSWHRFSADSSQAVVDFKIDSYPFIPATSRTGNLFTAIAFYLHSDNDDPEESFGVPAEYLGDRYHWEIDEDTPGLLLSYPNYTGRTPGVGSVLFTTNETMAAESSTPRKLAYDLSKLPADKHFVINVVGTTDGPDADFDGSQYLTIGYYGYAKSPPSHLQLVAYDDTRFYFNDTHYYHPPSVVTDFGVVCDDADCAELIFSWDPAADEDMQDVLTYEIQYVLAVAGDSADDNDLFRNSWSSLGGQRVAGEPIFHSSDERFYLQVPLNNINDLQEKIDMGVPLNLFFGIKAVDSEELRSNVPAVCFINIPANFLEGDE